MNALNTHYHHVYFFDYHDNEGHDYYLLSSYQLIQYSLFDFLDPQFQLLFPSYCHYHQCHLNSPLHCHYRFPYHLQENENVPQVQTNIPDDLVPITMI